MAILSVESLRKDYRYVRRRPGLSGLFDRDIRTVKAVTGISFEIAERERVAIIGPNGAGKSTTLKMLSGILEPTDGAAAVLGFVPWKQRRQLAYRIGVVFGQRTQLWTELPARDSFALLRRIYDVDQATFDRRLNQLVERFGLGPILDQPVQRLSLGQRMRCEIVASLLHGPSLLFLDEPTIGLDITAKAAIRDFIREHAGAEGQTVVLTSHDTRDIELVCDRVIVINEGRIVVDQPTDQLRRQFLGHRLVTLRSAAPEIALDLPGVTRRTSEPHLSVFEVDTRATRVDAVVEAALAKGGIEDITIEDPPMEEVVRAIYDANRAR
ncbi:MAG: ATP-binding cassette domain-containing protein [Alphaproteobacteria bacterium]|nr:ATP-binding cassette domain-containing protein [Alphaproteobacteria bacterium]MBL6937110.1 ATP-binding cassette domain-containing protein [Alphaproteobacteria bacterium]MBL7096328.1 ATP-binding cassette domain-containing protein [Alphaproteobacteria bacterium]